MNPSRAAHFERLYRSSPDPWDCDTRWYERRKRALVLASLPRPRYRRAYEPACGNGALTAELARRCDLLVAGEGSAEAARLVRARLASERHVEVRQQSLPDDWGVPGMRPDLIVFSEIGYYLDAPALAQVAAHIGRSLAPDGDLVACHWRGRPDDFERGAEEVHAVLGGIPGLHALSRHIEDDFLLEVWSRDPRPVGERHDGEAGA